MSQRLDPTGDLSTDSWTSTPLWSELNDGASPDDSGYVQANAQDGTAHTFEVSVGSPPKAPDKSQNVVVTVRAKMDSGATDQYLGIYLMEGATQRGYASQLLTTSYANYTLTVAASTITNFSNLSVKVTKQTSS
jgi:hypothetical protein